jgi:hypothetical protein
MQSTIGPPDSLAYAAPRKIELKRLGQYLRLFGGRSGPSNGIHVGRPRTGAGLPGSLGSLSAFKTGKLT